ncbi:MAG: DNA-processing protein DprA [Scytolyngbya sp. HA4215-MV1]|jgi:DNA processing protein|nr:DNA-processing protein DprA [Scytolyngbya sp. HA4215-MV1]
MAGLGPVLIRRLHRHFGSLAIAWEVDAAELLAVEGLGIQTATTIAVERSRLCPAELLEQHLQHNPDFWTPADADYPQLLLEIPDPPPVLYYRGSVELQENQGIIPAIAMVGTRDPSEYGKRWTRRIATALAQNGFTVVSGLADGVDTEAHQSSIHAGGRTIAVLGTGLNRVYPWSNRKLYEQLLEQGLALSEYPADTPPDRTHFPRRNRIVAGLCRAVLVMEAPKKSGALITATIANEYGRDVYALPGSLDNDRAYGCLELVNKGAQLILSEHQLLEALGTLPQFLLPPAPVAPKRQPMPELEPTLQQVLQTVTDLAQESPEVSFDRIVQSTELVAGSVSSALLQLELLGLVAQLPGMRYRAS